MQRNKVVLNVSYGGFSLSKKACEYLSEKYNLNFQSFSNLYVLERKLKRHDPRLVEVVQVLGDKASGICAQLSIVEIEGSTYRIEDYDGCESVITPEDQTWIVI